MGFFGKKSEGGMLDVIRCDEAQYLVWKWRRDARRDQEHQEDRRRGRPVEADLGELGIDE